MGWACRLNPKSNCDPRRRRKRKEGKMLEALSSAVKRFGRAGLALIIAGSIAYVTKDPKWLMLAPFVQAVAKYLRKRFDIPNIPI